MSDGDNSDKEFDETALLEESDNVEPEVDESFENGDNEENDPELEAIKERVKAMEAEAEKLKVLQSEVEKHMHMDGTGTPGSYVPTGGPPISAFPTLEEKVDADNRSIYVGQVDYGSTAEELEQHFHGCGAVNRVTIICDKFTGQPKGFAYIEFAEKESVDASMALEGSMFRDRQIKVMPKRTNKPGISTTDRGRGRGRGRSYRGGYRGYRGRGMYRGRGRPMYAPY